MANKQFWSMICVFIESMGYCTPSWSVWLDIRGMALSNKTVPAVKLLRDSCFRMIYTTPNAEQLFAEKGLHYSGNRSFDEFVLRNAEQERKDPLSLKECKAIIDWLIVCESIFEEADTE